MSSIQQRSIPFAMQTHSTDHCCPKHPTPPHISHCSELLPQHVAALTLTAMHPDLYAGELFPANSANKGSLQEQSHTLLPYHTTTAALCDLNPHAAAFMSDLHQHQLLRSSILKRNVQI